MDRVKSLEPTPERIAWAAQKAFAAWGPLQGLEPLELVGTEGFLQLFYWWLARAPHAPREGE